MVNIWRGVGSEKVIFGQKNHWGCSTYFWWCIYTYLYSFIIINTYKKIARENSQWSTGFGLEISSLTSRQLVLWSPFPGNEDKPPVQSHPAIKVWKRLGDVDPENSCSGTKGLPFFNGRGLSNLPCRLRDLPNTRVIQTFLSDCKFRSSKPQAYFREKSNHCLCRAEHTERTTCHQSRPIYSRVEPLDTPALAAWLPHCTSAVIVSRWIDSSRTTAQRAWNSCGTSQSKSALCMFCWQQAAPGSACK